MLSTEKPLQFTFFRPEYSEVDEGVCVGYRLLEGRTVAEITVHHMKSGFRRELCRTIVTGKAKAGKCYEIVIHPEAPEESVVLGAKFFLLTRGVI